MKKVGLKYKGKKINFEAKECKRIWKFIGLMFSRRENAENLFFEFRKPEKISIHSWFVFYSFVAVWLDDKNKIIEIKRIKPFRFGISPKGKFSKLIEIPINRKNIGIVKSLVGKEKSLNTK